MEQQNKNKEFIINYFNAMESGVSKTRQFLEHYMTDEALIEHIEFFEAAFPGYNIYIDEMTAEGNRVIVQARLKGTHMGDLTGIPPTYKLSISQLFHQGHLISQHPMADDFIVFNFIPDNKWEIDSFISRGNST